MPASQSSAEPVAWHVLSGETVAATPGVDAAAGLSSVQAKQHLAAQGSNALPELPPRPLWCLFARQFASPLIYILFVAARRRAGGAQP